MLGKVRIDSLLARGGIAEVYLGEHVSLQREVAVKILRTQYEDDPDLLKRFQREARVVGKLRHPNIVQVFDFDAIDSRPYLVMEYIPGPSLSRYLHALQKSNGQLELPIISRLLTRLASALQYAHESGVIHRDVKPGNILLTSRSSKVVPGKPLPMDFEPILTDFGLVRFLNSSRQTTTGQIAGTPAYMSPEQARGEPADERTDIYSLGVVLYELLSGHLPFDGDTTMSIILKHVTEPPPPIPGLSIHIQNVLNIALAKKPDERYQTPNDLAEAFNAVMDLKTDSDTLMNVQPSIVLPPARKVGYRTKFQKKWMPAFLSGVTVVFVGAFFLLRGIFIPGLTSQNDLPTQPTSTNTTNNPSSFSLGPTGILRFQDGSAILDKIIMTALAMPAPPEGCQYEVWLMNGEERLSLGILSLDENGKGSLTVENSEGINLLALYDQVEITIEPIPDLDPATSGQVAFSFTLPAGGLEHVRHLLVSFPGTPNGTALIQGLFTDSELIYQIASEMQSAYQKGDRASTLRNAESIMNILVGRNSQSHKDWNGDGQITDPGDGYGLILNGNNLGYIWAVYSHADYAVISPDTTQNMIVHGGEVKICAQNLAQWTPQLRDLIEAILASAPNTDLTQPIQESVILAGQMLNGIDQDNNKKIELIPDECGASSAYENAYYMADMPLLPVNLATIPTITVTGTVLTPSPSASPTSVVATKKPNNSATQAPPNTNPTKKPNPTKRPTKTPNRPQKN